jgi:hypothetical protein
VTNTARLDDPGALAGVLTGVSFIGGLATGLSLADAPFPQPGADVTDVQRFFQGDAGPERINVGGQLLSAASLALFTASVARLAGRASRGSRTLQAMAVAGGALASVSLAVSASAAAALTAAPGRDNDKASSLHRLLFAMGGPVHGAGLALLLGALGLAGRRTGALPRPLTTAALASAGIRFNRGRSTSATTISAVEVRVRKPTRIGPYPNVPGSPSSHPPVATNSRR